MINLTSAQMLSIITQGLPHTKKQRNILIIGAGISGLVTASLLKKAGHNITILEANNMIGGRIKTIRSPFSPGLYGEAGAMRIPSFHPLVQAYIQKFNLPISEFIHVTDQSYIFVNGVKISHHEYESNPDLLGYPVQDTERGKTAEQLFQEALEQIGDISSENITLNWPAILQNFDRYSLKNFLKNYANLSDGAREMIGVLMQEEEIMMTSFLRNLRDQTSIKPGNKYYQIEGGFDQLPNSFLPELANDIIYRAQVYQIEQHNQGVTIRFFNPNHYQEKLQITADFAVVTIPFSALRFVEIKPIKSFRHQKLKAIRQLHYETSTKILIEFKSRFWENEEIKGGKTITDLPIRATYYPSSGIGKTGGAVILASYTWGSQALLWDGLSAEHRLNHTLQNLAMIHGEQVYDQFVRGVSHSWLKDSYTLGAFAVLEPEQESELYPDVYLSEGRIHFAGEHTSLTNGWIEGAIESGIRAAWEINSGN